MQLKQCMAWWGWTVMAVAGASVCLGQIAPTGTAPDVVDNLLLNPSFEDGFDHWSLTLGARESGDEIRSTVGVDTTESHTGHSSIRINGSSDTTVWLAAKSAPVAVRPETQYILSTWIKTDRVQCEFGQYENSNAYVQFFDSEGQIARIDRSPVRATPTVFGTHDWARMYRVVMSPAEAVSAVVGVALTCTGTAWFDDVALGTGIEVRWKEQPTDRFIYLREEGEGPKADVIAENKRFLESLERVLGLRHPEQIRYYKYASGRRKRAVSGNPSTSHYTENAIHSVRWDGKNMLPGVLMWNVGSSTPFLANGIASYAISSARGTNPHESAKKMAEAGMLKSAAALNGPAWPEARSQPWVQNLSTSFVGYLCEQYGMSKFKEFYAFNSPEEAVNGLGARATKVYGRSLEELDREWQKFLKHLD